MTKSSRIWSGLAGITNKNGSSSAFMCARARMNGSPGSSIKAFFYLLRRMTMSAETKYRKANRFGWHSSAAAFVAVVILFSPLREVAQAADKDGAKPMGSMDMQKSMTKEKDMSKAMDSMEMHNSMMKGMKDMESMPASGDTDRDFAMMMKKHHQSALDMANVELQHGKDPNLRTMAKGIITSQTKEIKEFDNWLAKHKKPIAEPMSKSK
jgi:Domain of unknown function (DUF305)